jgi:hypothetical protein
MAYGVSNYGTVAYAANAGAPSYYLVGAGSTGSVGEGFFFTSAALVGRGTTTSAGSGSLVMRAHLGRVGLQTWIVSNVGLVARKSSSSSAWKSKVGP